MWPRSAAVCLTYALDDVCSVAVGSHETPTRRIRPHIGHFSPGFWELPFMRPLSGALKLVRPLCLFRPADWQTHFLCASHLLRGRADGTGFAGSAAHRVNIPNLASPDDCCLGRLGGCRGTALLVRRSAPAAAYSLTKDNPRPPRFYPWCRLALIQFYAGILMRQRGLLNTCSTFATVLHMSLNHNAREAGEQEAARRYPSFSDTANQFEMHQDGRTPCRRASRSWVRAGNSAGAKYPAWNEAVSVCSIPRSS